MIKEPCTFGYKKKTKRRAQNLTFRGKRLVATTLSGLISKIGAVYDQN